MLACVCSTTGATEPSVIDTVAGTGRAESNDDAGQARQVNIGNPFGVTLGPDGALYIAEGGNHRVLRLDLTTSRISTVVGCGEQGYAGDGGPAVNARLNEPYEVRFDRGGNMYIVEMRNHVVRRVDADTRSITTVAGTGKQGYSGDGGPASAASLNQPHSIAIDSSGALYIADIGNHRIRKVDPKTGIVESIAGNDERSMPRDGQSARRNPILGPRALWIDENNLWIALREGHSIWRMGLDDGILHHIAGTGEAGYSGDGGPAIRASFNGPKGIAVGPHGSLFVADTENNAIRKIDLISGRISTVVVENANRVINDPPLRENRGLNGPHGICIAPDGAIYIADTLNHLIRRVR